MLSGFKAFVLRGNVVELAVGIAIGAAFGAVVGSLNTNLLLPLVAAIFGEPDFSTVGAFTINGAEFYPGAVLTSALNFLLIAVAIYFLIVVPMNRLAARGDAAATEPAGPTELALLTEIRDLLATRDTGTPGPRTEPPRF
ncbi:MAG: large conductance mechanosensitive channel protein MscL [Actinobacteria bacterium HGW-Actinobacteria-4]|nr:MAG: large conductance mechanosensitive channel protein MscL [Actinobacteria bacterium HGW-Actinobacteria-4]